MTVQQIRHAGASKIEGRGVAWTDTGEERVDHFTNTKRTRGRPAGSKNRPKGLIPKELASEFLGVIREILPQEQYEEMRQAIQEGKTISTLAEARITLKLMGPPIWQRLLAESRPKAAEPSAIDADALDEIGGAPQQTQMFSRDLNERLKVYMSLMDFIDKSERRDDEATDSRKKPVLEIFAGRGLDAGRLKLLVGIESGSVGRGSDETGEQSSGPRALPDSVAERSISVSDNEEVEADWDIDGDGGEDSLQPDDPSFVQR
jgi:hypothetical protein